MILSADFLFLTGLDLLLLDDEGVDLPDDFTARTICFFCGCLRVEDVPALRARERDLVACVLAPLLLISLLSDARSSSSPSLLDSLAAAWPVSVACAFGRRNIGGISVCVDCCFNLQYVRYKFESSGT